MADKLSAEKRSWNMSRIKGRDTKPEIAVRSLLHRMGYRFRLQRKDLPGKPDIVLPKYKTAIFVHGCFWHAHGCKDSGIPKTNTGFWQKKLADNVQRDVRKQQQLLETGWRILVAWECQLNEIQLLEARLRMAFEKEPERNIVGK